MKQPTCDHKTTNMKLKPHAKEALAERQKVSVSDIILDTFPALSYLPPDVLRDKN